MTKKNKFNLVSTETGRFSSKHPNLANKPKAEYTHTGNLIGGMLTKKTLATVALYKAKGCWVDPKGSRYSEKDGYQVDNAWSLQQLDLDTIMEIPEK